MGSLFRKEAVDNYREQFSINRQITKISFSTILLMLIFVSGLLLTVVWFLFGNIVNTVEITGVVYPAGGIEKINVSNAGIISDITVSIGENVEVGDILAVIPDEDILNEIETAAANGAENTTIEKLRQDYYNSSVIVSKTEGTVISVSDEGTYVQRGDTLAEIAASRIDNNQRQILAFLPTNQKNNISEGCSVQVSPDYAPREKFGYINGYVADIGNEIITKSDAEKKFDIYNIPNLLDENETYIPVYINLLPDENSVSGLDWSENRSNSINVESGTICSSSVVISEIPPYKWLMGGGS